MKKDLSESTSLQMQSLVAAYQSSESPKHYLLAQKMKRCGQPIEWTSRITGEVSQGTWHCDVRSCRRCQAKLQRKFIRESIPWIEKAMETTPYEYLFMTIGFKNVPVDRARAKLDEINKGFKQLCHRSKKWPGLGTVTTREFTISNGEIHFNTHSLIAVEPEYFESESYAYEDWPGELRKRFRFNYSPNVNIKKVRGYEVEDALREFVNTLRYCMKPQKFETDPEVGLQLADQLHGTRRVTVSGLFRQLKSECELEQARNRGW